MNEYIKEIPVFLNTKSYSDIYTPDSNPTSMVKPGFVDINLVVSGNGIHKITNEAEECRSGDIHITGGGVFHSYYAKSDDEIPTVCTISFNPSGIFEADYSNSESKNFCFGIFRDSFPFSSAVLNSEIMKEFFIICKSLSEEINSEASDWQVVVKSKLAILLVKLGRYVNMADTVRCENTKDRVIVTNAKRLVEKNFHNNNMTLEKLASALYVSPSCLSRIFKRVTGENFADYVRNIRIDKACELLRTTNYTNEKIINHCGLKDIPSFYRIFKSRMNMTPYQYKMSKQTYKGESIMSIFIEISENLQKGKAKIVKELVQKAIDDGLPAVQILNESLIAGMNVVGEKFKNNEVYVPEVLVAARAMNQGMMLLKPFLVEDGVQSKGKVCIGTVQGDLHDIGKNLVKMMMEGKGLEVIDLGTDVTPEAFVQAAIENECSIICCSALLTTTMSVMADVVKAVESAGIRDKVKIMIGGAPVTEQYCNEIGADCYTSDAASAADAAVELCRAI